MDLVLKIFGALFLILIGIIGLAILTFWAFRLRLKKAADALADLPYSVTPPRLRLVRRSAVEWNDAGAAQALVQTLLQRGFQDAGAFGAREMPFLRLQGLANPDQRVYAVVYEHDQAGVWTDLVTRYVDGTALTVSSAPRGAELDQQPGHGKTYLPRADARTLLERMLETRPNRPMRAVEPEEFEAVFEQAYAEEMDWRNSRGYTEDEVRRTLLASGDEVSEEDVELVWEQMEEQALLGLDVGLREKYLARTSMSAAEWEEVRERLVFVHDRLPREHVAGLLSEYAGAEDAGEEDYLARTPEGIPARQAFAQANAALSPDRRCEKLDEVSEPLPADVYVAPECMEDWEDDEE